MTPAAQLLARIGWSDPAAGERMGVSPNTVRQWRTGRRNCRPELLEWLGRVADALDGVGPCPRARRAEDAP